ncbi:MAG: hypothetical protein WKF84_15905 [Pyrinomonadaceae bacterium]
MCCKPRVVSSYRIFKTLDLPLAVTSPAAPKKDGRAAGRIEFDHVWFAYKNEDWVLKDVSFTVEPGQSIALVGHTGSGQNNHLKFADALLRCAARPRTALTAAWMCASGTYRFAP